MSLLPTANILLVDDYEPNLLALEATINDPQYKLFEATSGAKAIELCSLHEFALIILDIQMPDLDGFDTARIIKSTKLNRDTPIIFVTAVYKEDPFVKKGYAVGAIDYFGKPFDPGILKAKVGIYTELYMKTKRLQENASVLHTHDQIKSLLDGIPVGIVVANKQKRIFENNSEAQEIWGSIPKCKIDELDQFKGWWPTTGQRLNASEWPLARALNHGEIASGELVNIESFQGVRKTIKNSAYPIKEKSGDIIGAIAIFQDANVVTANWPLAL